MHDVVVCRVGGGLGAGGGGAQRVQQVRVLLLPRLLLLRTALLFRQRALPLLVLLGTDTRDALVPLSLWRNKNTATR